MSHWAGLQAEPPSKGHVLSNQDLKSALELPWGGEVSAARRLVRGRSWSPFGKITSVEYSMDQGKRWQTARLREPNIEAAWVRWDFDWEAKPGKHMIRVRATDEKGNTQPDIVPFNQRRTFTMRWWIIRSRSDSRRRLGGDYLKQVSATFPASIVVHSLVENGRAAEVIVDSASKDSGTLITMATHGRFGGQRWLLGSVAQKVLQAAVNPLLLIRPIEETRSSSEVGWSTIILPLDGSHLAEKIFPHVVYLATRLKLGVVLFRAYTVPTTSYFMASGISPSAIGKMGAKIREETTDYLQAKAEQLQAEGIEKVSRLAVEGKGPEEIIELARKTPHNLIAVSTHGRTRMGRWVLGSVTDRVVSYSGDPVLVIRPLSS